MPPSADRSPKRKLIDLLLTKSDSVDLAQFADRLRAGGVSWADVAARIYARTGETVNPTWLIRQLGEPAEAVAE